MQSLTYTCPHKYVKKQIYLYKLWCCPAPETRDNGSTLNTKTGWWDKKINKYSWSCNVSEIKQSTLGKCTPSSKDDSNIPLFYADTLYILYLNFKQISFEVIFFWRFVQVLYKRKIIKKKKAFIFSRILLKLEYSTWNMIAIIYKLMRLRYLEYLLYTGKK